MTLRGFRWVIPIDAWEALCAANTERPFADVRERLREAGMGEGSLRQVDLVRLYADGMPFHVLRTHLNRIRRQTPRRQRYLIEELEAYEHTTMGTLRQPVVAAAPREEEG
jgi:hypothetical protein